MDGLLAGSQSQAGTTAWAPCKCFAGLDPRWKCWILSTFNQRHISLRLTVHWCLCLREKVDWSPFVGRAVFCFWLPLIWTISIYRYANSLGYPVISQIPHLSFALLYTYLPTSGDLKSGDSLFCTTPPPPTPECQQHQHPTPHPPPLRASKFALGHYMTSYMTYMGSKCAFIIVMTN